MLDPAVLPRQTANAEVSLDCLVATLRDNNASAPCYLATDGDITSSMEQASEVAGFVPRTADFWARLKEVSRRLGVAVWVKGSRAAQHCQGGSALSPRVP